MEQAMTPRKEITIMTNPANEPNEQQNNDQQSSQGHPAWSEILNEVPEDLRPILEPKLQEWDRHYSTKLQGTVEQLQQFEAYKPLVEHNVSLDNVQKALWLAQQLEQNPDEIVKSAIEHYGLGYVPADQINNNQDDNDNDFDLEDDDNPLKGLESHPAFKEVLDKARQIEEWQNQQRQAQEEEESMSILEETLSELHDKFDIERPDGTKIPGFDDMFVTALMANGINPEDAVKRFNDTVTQRAQLISGNAPQDDPPPVVMGGDGTTGTGMPTNPVNMGSLKKGELDQMVLDMIEQAKQQ